MPITIEGDRLQASPSPSLRGAITVPGDKSMSHRALILGAMASEETRIRGLLEGADVLHTAAAISAFGARVKTRSGEWSVQGCSWRSPARPVECGNSGTGARLLMGAAAGQPITATFCGDASLAARPMERVLAPLRRMGANTRGERLPVTVRGGRLKAIRLTNRTASAQVKSAVLLAGLNAAGVVEVAEPSPSRDHTENMLRAFGCEVDIEPGRVRLGKRRALVGTSLEIPGDPSSAAFPIVAALTVPGSEVEIGSVMVNPLRSGLIETLLEMGADIRLTRHRVIGGERVADLAVRTSRLRGVAVPAERAPSMIDEYPVLAVAAACAAGRTVMKGLAELRLKESDRLETVIAGLRVCGVDAYSVGDTLIVEGCGGAPPGGARIWARLDHRIAMSFLVLGLASAAPVEVDSANMIGTSFPGFTGLMRSLGARIS